MSGYERRDVPGYPGWRADTDGRVWFNDIEPEMRTRDSWGPYLVVKACDRWVKRATLVCLAFHDPRPPHKELCAHYNDVKDDDRPENLRWATHAENMADACRNGLRRKPVAVEPEPVELTAPGQLISTKLAAGSLGITPNRVRQLIADRRLTGYTIGRLVKVDAAEVERFILANASDACAPSSRLTRRR